MILSPVWTIYLSINLDTGSQSSSNIDIKVHLTLWVSAFFLLFYYSYVHTMLGSFLPPAPTPKYLLNRGLHYMLAQSDRDEISPTAVEDSKAREVEQLTQALEHMKEL
jgi:hypothetical protein